MLTIEYQTPKKRLFCFVLILLLSLMAIESLVRENASLFEAASQRVFIKAALFEKKPKVDFLFLGTSRTQDGVAPRLVSRRLGEISSALKEKVGFNAAVPGSSSEDILGLIPRYLSQPHLRLIIIELSTPYLGNSTSIIHPPMTQAQAIESILAYNLQRLDVVRYRTAFQFENLGRLPSLFLFSSSLSGCEVKFVEQLRAWRGQSESSPVDFDQQRWTPEIIQPSNVAIPLDNHLEFFAKKMTALADAFSRHGIKVVFAIPPLTAKYQPAPERDTLRPLYGELARRTHSEIWNFAALPMPDSFFKDPSHLNKDGRGHWSYALAQQLAKKLESH